MKEFETNTATTQDWLTARQNIAASAYELVLAFPAPSEDSEGPAPGNPVQLPKNVAEKLFSRTQPGLPPIGHDI